MVRQRSRRQTGLAILLAAVWMCVAPPRAHADQEVSERDQILRKILASGDGRSAATAYRAPRLPWEYTVLMVSGLRFQQQRVAPGPEGEADVITAFDPRLKLSSDIWFRVVPDPEFEATASQKFSKDAENHVRRIMVSGDGLSAETAFVVGDDIPIEYQILRIMGLRSEMQSLAMIGGCGFDIQSVTTPDTKTPMRIYFNIGHGPLRYDTHCVVDTKDRNPR